ncbi:hypothetical protein AAEU41_12575 [Pantoea agglomerans]
MNQYQINMLNNQVPTAIPQDAPKVLGVLKKSFNFMTLVPNSIISVRLHNEKYNHRQNNKLYINQRLTEIAMRTLSDNIGPFIAPNHAPCSILPPNLPPKLILFRGIFSLT